MSTTNHITFEELANNVTDVFNKVRAEHKAVVVEYKTGEKILIKPVTPGKAIVRRGRMRTKADIEAFRAAAGSWKDEDVDTLLKNVYESRRNSSRPAVEL